MGRIYRSVEIGSGENKAITVSIIDTGADETVISGRIAKMIRVQLYGTFRAICATDTVLEGQYADVTIKDLSSERIADMIVGVSDIPFNTDDIDDEGVDIILGIDYIQKTGLEIKS